MVIERFRGGAPDAVGRRFREKGRMIPEGNGVEYVASWMTCDGTACYQIMESPSRAALVPWLAAWDDLVDFEVVAVQDSADFWAKRSSNADR